MNRKESNNLFFIGVLIPEAIASKITNEKIVCSELFGSKHALKTLPHITLIPPFRMHPLRSDKLKALIDQVGNCFLPIQIELNGFGFFEQGVVFVNVSLNPELMAIHSEVREEFHTYFPEIKVDSSRFHPHVTIAHRDLDQEHFIQARKFFSGRNFRDMFECRTLSLFNHNGAIWETV